MRERYGLRGNTSTAKAENPKRTNKKIKRK